MEIDPNKKYAIVPVHHMAIPLEKLAELVKGAINIEKGYESNHGYRFYISPITQLEIQIIEGEQIIADTAIKRMSEGPTS